MTLTQTLTIEIYNTIMNYTNYIIKLKDNDTLHLALKFKKLTKRYKYNLTHLVNIYKNVKFMCILLGTTEISNSIKFYINLYDDMN